MNLLSGLPKEVAKRLQEHAQGVLEVDATCDKHPRYNKLLMPDGEIICPICHKDERDAVVAEEKTKEYFQNSVEGRRQYLYEESIISNKRLLEKGFRDFHTKTPAEASIRKQAESLAMSVASSDPVNIYLQGVPGCGKSHLAMGLLRNANALANGKRCLFVNFPALKQKIRRSYDNQYSEESEPKLIQKMIAADILVLDDIADEINPKTQKTQVSNFSARILYAVMDARGERKPTIFTSNISWLDLKKLLDQRVTSRMSYRQEILSFNEITDKRGEI